MTTPKNYNYPAYLPNLPICEISFRDDWTPQNQTYFSQCINSCNDGKTFCSKQKKRWKRAKCPYKNENMKRKCVVYKYVPSSSQNSASEEFSSNEECENISSSISSDSLESDITDENDALESKNTQLSEYEKMLQKNREEKIAFLKEIKVTEAIGNFQEALKDKTGRKMRKCQREAVQNSGDESQYMKINIFVDDTSKKRAGKKIEKGLPCVLPFKKALLKGHTYHDFICDESESEFRVSQLDSDYVSHFEKMKFQTSQTMQFSSFGISSMAVHESQEKIILCIGNTNGKIVFRHVNLDSNVCVFQPHCQRVSNLKFNPFSPNVLISSSIDGTMYHGDFEKKIFRQIFEGESCYHFDVLSATSYLVTHGIEYVSIIDSRSPKKAFQKRHKCSADFIKTVNLHPIKNNYFISGHQKGSVKLWDLRKLQDEPVIDVNYNEGNLISSFFSPISGNSVLVTLSDTICLLDSSSLNEKFELKNSIEHENCVLRKANFEATWLPNTDNAFVVGSKSSPRKIEIFDDKLCNIFNFTNKCLDEIAAVNVFHSSLPFLASASKGKVFIISENE